MIDKAKLPDTPPVLLRIDGSCWPNPGPMGIGYTIENQAGHILVRVGAEVGQGTNNAAEYNALIAGLRHCIRLGLFNVTVISDSLLVVNQVKGLWAIRDKPLGRLADEAKQLIALMGRVELKHTPREGNTGADELSRQRVFEEPKLPVNKHTNAGHRVKLYDFQAQFIQHWDEMGFRNAYFMGRIFGMDARRVEEVKDGYAWSTWKHLPEFHRYIGLDVDVQLNLFADELSFPAGPRKPTLNHRPVKTLEERINARYE